MEAYRELFQEQLTEAPKKMLQKTQDGYDTERGWVFVTNDFVTTKAVRTYQTLFAISNKHTYFTPNTFYRNDKRNAGTLRWLNAFVIDIDVKNGQNEGLGLPDLLDRIESAGLPLPSMVVKTPSGGYHTYFYLDTPKRALPKVVNLFEMIQQQIAKEIGGDIQAVGAERWFRIPAQSNIVYRSETRVSFSDLCDWFSIQTEFEAEEQKRFSIQENGLLSHPAIIRIENGVSKGQRDNACYTLALAYKASGLTVQEAEQRLLMVNDNNEPPLTRIEVKRKVKSAYKASSPKGPSAFWIRELSGLPFTYRPMEGAKPREERKYSHIDEWKEDVLTYLKKHEGAIIGSQRALAEEMGIPYSSFKEVIALLINENRITKLVEGKGRAAKTILNLTNIVLLKPKKKAQLFNGPNSNTFRDRGAGWPEHSKISMATYTYHSTLDSS
ncbi:primase C-terminal domain-containing protein [Cytobacillus firmus]|uniref:primase C-terminal domain-containing protein n=1 Tax=Cytobacillus firmus TaxID=1399 RepID=UPI00237B4523|nr:primase C-terminal domain-containing protein [Cytobacillus firmus]MDD9309731.1 primase C-terminal domain-containing protein [Cytobacillus firmus]